MEDYGKGKGKTETLILSKKDEQERVQKKTFTNWINTYLIQAHPPYKIENLYESIKDGLCLIHLLEVMTGEKLRKETPKNMQKIHRLSNINSALEFLKKRNIKLVNINATDIADGRPSIILGLMWTVILFFQIEEQEELLIGALGNDFDAKGSAKASLLNWVNKTIGEKYDLNVTDFGPSWRDGKAFNALVHNIDSSLINWDDVKNKSNKDNLNEAFKQAEELGIPHLLDALDVDVEKPDEKSIMTYITQFLKSYPEGGKGIEEDIVAINRAKEEAAQKALEEERERLRLEEEERQRKEEEERQRREEEERKRKEEERKRKEEEERQRREEEERKRKEEERKRKEEEERQKRLAEDDKRKNYNNQMKNMGKWIEDLNSFLNEGIECNKDSISNYLENLTGLLSDKDLIDGDLASLKDDIKSGKCGSEYVKPLLNDIQDFEKQLKDSIGKANNVKGALTQNHAQLKACEKSMDQVSDWIKNFDKSLEEISETENPSKSDKLMSEFQSHLYTEPKIQASLKEAKEMLSKLKLSAPKNLNDKDLQKKIADIENKLKDKVDKGNTIDKSIKEFDKSLAKANDWMKDYEKKMNNIGPLSNDMSKLKQQLDKLESLKRLQGDGDKIIQDSIEKGQAALTCTKNLKPIQKKVNSELEDVENKWLQNTDNLDQIKDEIMGKIAKIEEVTQSGNKVDNWLKEKDTDLKASKSPCDTLAQKQAKIEDLKKLLDDVESECPIIESYLKQLSEIADSDPNALKKLNATKQQLDNLKKSIKDAIKDTEDRVKNHEQFVDKLDAAGEWVEMAKALKLDATNKDSPGTIEELKRKKDIIEKLIESKSNGENLLKAVVTSGESVARETSSKGKEDILNGVRSLNRDFLDFTDGLGAAKQAIELKLTKAMNVDRDLTSLDSWANDFERKLNNVADSDIDKIKLLCDEAQAKLFMADNLCNQAKSLDDPESIARAEKIKEQIKRDLDDAQKMHQQIRENMHMYNDLIKNCKNMDNWINDSEKKMMRYGDSPGSNPDDLLNNLKSLEKLAEDVKSKRSDLEKIQHLGSNLSHSSPSKSGEINSSLEKLERKYQNLMENLEDKDRELRNNIKDQKEFDESMHKAQQWLNDATQKLLKYSDVKQCIPSMLDSFSQNFENILDSLPYGEESMNSALSTGQKHMAHLKEAKSQGPNNLERDSKRINELEKNWNDFKKQIDNVDKNVHRVKDNLNEFNMMHQKLENYIKDKENAMNDPHSIDSLKYMLSELDDVAKDVDKFQINATEISGSLNYPSAPFLAKGLSDRYENLKRDIEIELNRSKELENDWVAYKNAVNACEKWIVDTGFRIIENDYSAFSPEDAQMKLDEYTKICDQINNFSQDVDKVVKIGKQLAGKLAAIPKLKSLDTAFTHSEGEIKTDTENLKDSHKNLVENANQTKNRLNEQLANWRKYRDLVQVNDQYLSNDLADWWRNKKYYPPQKSEDIDHNLQEADEILKSLLSKQAEMKMSKSNCESLSRENGPRKFSEMAEMDRKKQVSQTTPLSRLADSVEAGFQKNIDEINKYNSQLRALLQDWKDFDKHVEELDNWTKDKEITFEKKIEQPSLKVSSLTDEQRQCGEQLKKEIDNQERRINELLEKGQTLGNRKINQILKRIENLKKKLKVLLDRKDEEIDAADFDTVDTATVACQNFGVSETIATQTLPEKCSISTSTEPRKLKSRAKTQTPRQNYVPVIPKSSPFGMRNSGGNRGISKMLYPYCCTSDLLNQKLHLDFVHGNSLKDNQSSLTRSYSSFRPSKMGISKIRNGTEESVRRNWMTQDLL